MADLATLGMHGVTRLAVSAKGDRIAIGGLTVTLTRPTKARRTRKYT